MKVATLLWKFKNRFSKPTPLITVTISKRAILNNLHTYQRQYPHTLCAPVLKSNAYGHGLIPVAQILDDQHLPFFVVDSLYEARMLRAHLIKTPILIIGYVPIENILRNKLKHITFTITSFEQLENLISRAKRPISIHLKIDTGMHRQGVVPQDIDACIKGIHANNSLILTGICSHFADADSTEKAFTESQIKVWNESIVKFQNAFTTITYIHISGTAGSAYSHHTHENMMRLGLGLYGINPSPFLSLPLLPALRMETIVGSVRKIKKGESVGYNGTFVAESDMKIATIPLGYFEGVDRRLSNVGYCTVKGAVCPIIGRVSMNITSLDVSSVPNVHIGDAVVVIDNDPKSENSVQNCAHRAHTIPWEILVHIPQHLKRSVVDDFPI